VKFYLWPLAFRCLDCKEKLKITEVLAAQDGDFKISGYCPNCPKDDEGKFIHFSFTTDWKRIKQYCIDCDSSTEESERGKPLKPPLALLPPTLSEEDKKYMREMHIDPENGKGDNHD
jgi:hypothetical protein